jgi:hypothetical protein
MPRNSRMEWMTLRSGDIIKCKQFTGLCVVIKKLIKDIYSTCYKTSKVTEISYVYYCLNCDSVINLLCFIEEHYEMLFNHPELINVYRYIHQEINNTIHKIEKGVLTCGCLSDEHDACMLLYEYDYYKKKYASISDNEKQELSSSFVNRQLYRLCRNNFLIYTEETDQLKEHDYNLILDELKLWKAYFQQEPIIITEARKILSHSHIKLDKDCVNNILEFI